MKVSLKPPRAACEIKVDFSPKIAYFLTIFWSKLTIFGPYFDHFWLLRRIFEKKRRFLTQKWCGWSVDGVYLSPMTFLLSVNYIRTIETPIMRVSIRVAVLLCFTLLCFALPCFWPKNRSSKTTKSKLCFALFCFALAFQKRHFALLCFARPFWANMP